MIYFLSLIVGLLLGSFANVCIARLPSDGSLIRPRSRCPKCGTPIRARDNIPILSFLIRKARCFSCGKSISWQYPCVETAMGLLFVFAAWRFPSQFDQMLVFDLLSFYLLTISIIDFHHKIIPDELSLSMLVMGLLSSFKNPYLGSYGLPPWAESFLAAFIGGGLMLLFAWVGEKVFKKEALGGGDIKLIAGLGAVLGWDGLVGSLALGSFVGGVMGGVLLLLKRKKRGDTIPYGPFLCFGAFVTALFPKWWTPFLSP
jgi:leader peptidase (prepilin peptidase) / N-methyltransferase